MRPRVSIITPTYDREKFLPLVHRAVLAQTYKSFEWLVLDDSPEPSPYMRGLADERIRYRHTTERMPLGLKRNELLREARGEIIVQLDDDDYYVPRYVERMVDELERGYDCIAFSGFYLYAQPFRAFAYWDLTRKIGKAHLFAPPNPIVTFELTAENNAPLAHNHLGYGFSYVFRRAVWERVPFVDEAHGPEDGLFARAAAERSFRLHQFKDVRGLALHILRGDNLSRCFPQYRIPHWALTWVFPSAVRDYVAQ